MEGIGDNIELEFVDPSGSGEYHLTTDPGEKDACSHVPSCGESISEVLSGRGKVDRFSNCRVIQTIEKAIAHDVPDSLFAKSLSQSSVYQKSVPLHPGLYRLDVVVKDVETGNIGVIGTALRVPQYEEGVLNASSLVLADKIEPVPSNEFGLGQFVFGAYKVRPRLSRVFTGAENLGIFLQLYNLKTDEALQDTNVVVTYRLLRDQKEIWTSTENSSSIRRDGEQLTLNRRLPLAAFAPGKYTLEIKIQDNVSRQTVTRTAGFEISPPNQ